MKQVSFAMMLLAAAVAGCSEPAPSCDKAVASLEEHMKETGLRVYVSATYCEDDKYSANVRSCLSLAQSLHALEKCADAQLQNCITNARGRENMYERCKSDTSLRELVARSAERLRYEQTKDK